MNKLVAYFSMEIGIRSDIPTYSGGLGVLAGDTLKSAADLGIPMVGVSLIYRNGYFNQKIWKGNQIENFPFYDPANDMVELPERLHMKIDGHDIKLRAWKYELEGRKRKNTLLFLDTDLPENPEWYRSLISNLYGGNQYKRIVEEAILGIGGVKILDRLGIEPAVYHLNEGHGAFATLELIRKFGKRRAKQKTVFTTHTPVPAGHDVFDYDDVNTILNGSLPKDITDYAGLYNLNMTHLAINRSRSTNAVAQKHGQISKDMFKHLKTKIVHITNGVHPFTWTSDHFRKLFDRKIPDWKDDPTILAKMSKFLKDGTISMDDIRGARRRSNSDLIDMVNEIYDQELFAGSHEPFDKDALTLGFARRFATYKRGNMMLYDPERLAKIGSGKIQIIYAGKAHPSDVPGKNIISYIYDKMPELRGRINIGFIENYNMDIGRILTAGSNVWVNNPQRPMEASGTSGMKAALNGVPQFSTHDGWWPETKGKGGWTIGPQEGKVNDHNDSLSFYTELENKVLPSFEEGMDDKIVEAIENAGFFNTHRMIKEYQKKIWKT